MLGGGAGGRVLGNVHLVQHECVQVLARVALDAREFPDRLMVPREAILERDDRRTMLFVFEPEGPGPHPGLVL